jgi:hypothetical protein
MVPRRRDIILVVTLSSLPVEAMREMLGTVLMPWVCLLSRQFKGLYCLTRVQSQLVADACAA